MKKASYIAAPPGQVYWRRQVCPHIGAKVLLKTIGGTCVVGSWYGPYGESFVAWSPMPKDGDPPTDIRAAAWLVRLRFAIKLIFSPTRA